MFSNFRKVSTKLFACIIATAQSSLSASREGDEGESVEAEEYKMSENYTPIDRARQLRKNMTNEEKILWQKLRGRRFLGLKFFRQHPVVYEIINKQPKFFIPDFYCAEKQLIIEIDGKIHDFQKEYHEKRAEILKNMGL